MSAASLASLANPPQDTAARYARRRPGQTLLYRLVEKHLPVLRERIHDAGGSLPEFVEREFEDYLKCGRLELDERGQVVYRLKTPWRDGTTHMLFDPVDFLARLAALVPRPRVNLIRFYGLFAPNCKRVH